MPNGSRGPGRQLARYRTSPLLLTPAQPFFRSWGPLPELRRCSFACTGTSDEQTRPGSEPYPSARGANPRVPLGLTSHLGPVRHEWLYRIAPRIIDTIPTTTITWGQGVTYRFLFPIFVPTELFALISCPGFLENNEFLQNSANFIIVKQKPFIPALHSRRIFLNNNAGEVTSNS